MVYLVNRVKLVNPILSLLWYFLDSIFDPTLIATVVSKTNDLFT